MGFIDVRNCLLLHTAQLQDTAVSSTSEEPQHKTKEDRERVDLTSLLIYVAGGYSKRDYCLLKAERWLEQVTIAHPL